jgi:hypothetical protein
MAHAGLLVFVDEHRGTRKGVSGASGSLFVVDTFFPYGVTAGYDASVWLFGCLVLRITRHCWTI